MGRMRSVANIGLLQIFFALVLVAGLMFVSNYLVYKNSIQGIYDQVSQNNKLVMKNIVSKFDESFKEIYNFIFSVQMHPFNTWEGTEGDNKIDMHDAYVIHNYLLSLVSKIDYIEEVVVYHEGSPIAITTAGTIGLQELFRSQYVHPTYHADYCMSLASTRHPLRVVPTQ